MQRRELPRLLGLWDGLAITIGRVVGTGIFLTAPAVAAAFTTAGPSIAVWIFGTILTMLGALTLAELSAGRPKTVGIAAILLLTAVSIVGTRYGSLVMKVFTPMKLVTLLLLVGLGVFLLDPEQDRFVRWAEFAAAEGSLLGALGLATMSVIWTFGGWESTANMAGEFREPQKSLPRIFALSIGIVAVVYLLVNMTYIRALGLEGLGETKNAARDTAERMIGPEFGALVTLMILCSIFSGFNSNILSGARVIHAMANTGLTFRFLGAQSARFETPHAALLWRTGVACLLVAAFQDFFRLLRFEVFAAQTFLILIAASLYVFRARGEDSPFRIPGYPWTPAIYILLNVAILANEMAEHPLEGTLVLAVMAAAAPAYYVWAAAAPTESVRSKPGASSPTAAFVALGLS